MDREIHKGAISVVTEALVLAREEAELRALMETEVMVPRSQIHVYTEVMEEVVQVAEAMERILLVLMEETEETILEVQVVVWEVGAETVEMVQMVEVEEVGMQSHLVMVEWEEAVLNGMLLMEHQEVVEVEDNSLRREMVEMLVYMAEVVVALVMLRQEMEAMVHKESLS